MPITEVLFATARRLICGKPIGESDRNHIHYQLLRVGITAKRTARLIILVCFTGGFLALAMSLSFNPQIAIVLACCWVIMVVGMFGFSYFGFMKQNKENVEPRNTLFLDQERIIQRNIDTLNKVKSLGDLNAFLVGSWRKNHIALNSFKSIETIGSRPLVDQSPTPMLIGQKHMTTDLIVCKD